MSNSYRHEPVVKISWGNPHMLKKDFSRRLRHKQKRNLQLGADEDEYDIIPSGNSYKRMNQQWDIVDFKLRMTWPEFKSQYTPDEIRKYFGSYDGAFREWHKTYSAK